jgi:hypothetical protein
MQKPRLQHTARQGRQVDNPCRSAGGNFFLQSQFLLLEGLDHRGVGHWPGHFIAQPGFKAGMLALKGVEV